MQGITLIIGVVGSVLALSLRPAYALATYFAVLVWYPYYLRISIGTIDISASRFVVLALLMRCLGDSRILRKFVWSRLDKCVAFSMVVYVGIYCITHPLAASVENRGGFLMDTWFTYITVRLIVRDRATLISFLKFTSVVLVALAILGVIESVTHWQPFLPLKRFRPWRVITVTAGGTIISLTRWGLTRAIGPFNHSIMFGSCLVMFLPLIWSLRHQRNVWGKLAYPLSGMAAVGAFCSMSSGPWVAGIATVFGLMMERFKRWVKPLLIATVLSCIFVGVVSNRSLHQILFSNANLAGGSSWQRVKLIDNAIEDFGKWWLAGYGGKDPGWKSRHAEFTDANNEFIKAGLQYGLLGIIALCTVLVTAFHGLVDASRETADTELRSLYWSLGTALFGIIVTWQGVSFFGSPLSLFYIILGMVGSSLGLTEHATFNMASLSGKSNIDLSSVRRQVG